MHYQAPTTPISLLADRQRLEQVFFNLVTNAIHYTDSGGSITIQYELDDEQHQVNIKIQDTGVGIPEEEQANIFLPFYRAEGNDRKGNGLGLSITSEIVKLHNGTVHVDSAAQKGSTFTVTLPVLRVDDPVLD